MVSLHSLPYGSALVARARTVAAVRRRHAWLPPPMCVGPLPTQRDYSTALPDAHLPDYLYLYPPSAAWPTVTIRLLWLHTTRHSVHSFLSLSCHSLDACKSCGAASFLLRALHFSFFAPSASHRRFDIASSTTAACRAPSAHLLASLLLYHLAIPPPQHTRCPHPARTLTCHSRLRLRSCAHHRPPHAGHRHAPPLRSHLHTAPLMLRHAAAVARAWPLDMPASASLHLTFAFVDVLA